MRINYLFRNGFLIPRIAAALCLASAAVALTFLAFAANPPSGTLSAATPRLTYSTGPNVQSNPSAQASLICNAALPCDDFLLTVDATGFVGTHNIVISVQWPVPAEDYDLYVYEGQPPGALLKTAASSADPEIAIIDTVPGVSLYTVRVVPFAVAGSTFTGTIEFVEKPTSPEPVPPGPGTPRYHNFAATGPMGNSAGEPTLGPGPVIAGQPGGRTMFIAGLETLRTTWNDCSSPASGPGFPGIPANFLPLWEDKSFATTSVTSLDPILHTDVGAGRLSPGRTFVSQLGPKTSFLAFTDNDGGEDPDTSNDYTPSQGSGLNSGVDHQNIGAGPYNPNAVPPPPPPTLYANAVYYASQDIAVAQMARSDNGGLTFGAAVPMYNLTQCGGLHGHLKVAPDGTVYLPNKGCGTNQGVVVSEDNGLNFVIRTVPGSSPGDTDPSVGVDAAGTIYFAYADGDGHAKVAVSTNKGSTWSTPVDVGAPFGIQNTVFPGAVGGDAGRATVMYLATDTGGGYEATGVFTGVWHIYASHTFDSGATWTTVRVSPANDPVQRGSICTSGTTCGADRNLLDFNDVEIDREGRVIIGYADGCIGCTSPTGADSRAAKATIARQSGGRRMIAAFDPSPAEPRVPASPRVDQVGEVSPGNVHLAWSEPDNGGSPLAGYNVYRRTDSGTYGAALATVTLNCPACKTTYDDMTAVPGTAYFYKVTALNAIGEGTNCGEFPIGAIVGGGDPCALPGVEVQADPVGDNTDDPIAQRDIHRLSVAEVYDATNPNNKLYITLRVGDLNPTPAPESRWTTFFTRVNPPGSPPAWGATTEWFVAMVTDDTGSPGTPVYRYGHTFIDPNPPNLRNLVTDGTADSGSNSVDGTILITISTPTRTNMTADGRDFPPLQTGETLTNVNAITQQGAGVLLATVDSTGNGAYTLDGNASCRPNSGPIARLTANPLTGTEPLLVNFDASTSSDPDTDPPPDTVVSSTFTFGDGTPPVNCPADIGSGCTGALTVQHLYAEDGNYLATVRVVDSRGKPSDNPAQVVIQVDPSGQTPTPTPPTPTPTASPSPSHAPPSPTPATPTPTPATPTPTPAPPTPSPATPTPTPTPSPGTCTENFDGVTAPALPAGWTAALVSGDPPTWETSTLTPDSPPNAAFVNDQNGVSDKILDSRPIVINSTAPVIRFRNNYDTEYDPPPNEEFWDGYVMEISVNGGPYADITDPAPNGGGGTFVTGGYTGEINGIASNPLAGRRAWSGDSGGYINTEINLGSHLNGQTVKLRFRMGTDLFTPGSGVRVDGLTINGGSCPPPTPSTPTPTPTVTPSTPTPTPTVTPSTPTPTPTITPPTPTPSPTVTPATPTPSPTVTPATPTPTPTTTIPASPTATATASATPTSTPSATATATASATVTPTASPSPSATPAAQTINLSTRMRVQTGDNVGIGGFILSGTAPKHVLLRAIGPSLSQFGVPNALGDTVLELRGPGGFATVINDNWQDDPAQAAAILATGLAPSNNLESAIDATLNPGAYTAVVRGKNNTTGVALIEVFDVNQAVASRLANISTRAVVSTGDDIVIAGFILGNNSGSDRIVARGIGPSLTAFGVSPALADPTLELRNNNGTLISSNNDWQDNPAQAAELTAAGLAPTNALESGIAATLPPGLYTALLAGLNNGTGIGLVEVYDRGGGP